MDKKPNIDFVRCATNGGKVVEKKLNDGTYIKLCINDDGEVFKTRPYNKGATLKKSEQDNKGKVKGDDQFIPATYADLNKLVDHFKNR